MPEKLQPELPHPVLHLPLRILEFPGAITHRTAKPQNPHSLVNIDLIVNTDTPVRRDLPVFLIMVPVYIQNRHGCKSRQKGKISGIQVSAGNNQINSRKLTFLKIIPQIGRLFIRNRKYFHKTFLTLLILNSLL